MKAARDERNDIDGILGKTLRPGVRCSRTSPAPQRQPPFYVFSNRIAKINWSRLSVFRHFSPAVSRDPEALFLPRCQAVRLADDHDPRIRHRETAAAVGVEVVADLVPFGDVDPFVDDRPADLCMPADVDPVEQN